VRNARRRWTKGRTGARAMPRACAFRFRDAANSTNVLNARIRFHTRASVRAADDSVAPRTDSNGTGAIIHPAATRSTINVRNNERLHHSLLSHTRDVLYHRTTSRAALCSLHASIISLIYDAPRRRRSRQDKLLSRASRCNVSPISSRKREMFLSSRRAKHFRTPAQDGAPRKVNSRARATRRRIAGYNDIERNILHDVAPGHVGVAQKRATKRRTTARARTRTHIAPNLWHGSSPPVAVHGCFPFPVRRW